VDVTLGVWAATLAGIVALVVLDFVTVSRTPHEVSFREAALWSAFYIGIAVAFGGGVWVAAGSEFGTEYFAAYLVEKSLSVDNLFVFVIILSQFAVPAIYHQRVLLVGVVLALAFRAVFIAIGAAALASFAFTFVIFGAILIWTGIGLLRHKDADPNPQDNLVVRQVSKIVPLTDQYDGARLSTHVEGRRVATPLFLVMIAIGSTDLLFALDSIPATFGVTQEAFLVFTANAFALLGLRALYFLLKGLLDKLVYLSLGLSVILIFIGVKLVLLWGHEVNPSVPHIETTTSLLVILVILVITAVASAVAVRRDPARIAHAGTVTEPRQVAEPGPRDPEQGKD
jgi:tellurite resistance protein TerC